MTKLHKTTQIILLLFLVGCAPRVVYRPVALSLPDKGELPVVPGEALQCLSDETYKAVIARDRMCRTQVKALEAAILSTHPEKKQARPTSARAGRR